jgi:hypothetical protein
MPQMMNRVQAVDAQAILTAGIQDISNTLVDGFKLNDILRIILETMYRAMGFKRVVLCIRDAKAGCNAGALRVWAKRQRSCQGISLSLEFYAGYLSCGDVERRRYPDQ